MVGKFKHPKNLIEDGVAMADLGIMLIDGAEILGLPRMIEPGNLLRGRRVPAYSELKFALEAIEAVADKELRRGLKCTGLANLRLLTEHQKATEEAAV